ncbi:protein PML [Dryobates pubescens]|uniref:protein PML n=1 Tax=Dryobates pubescens TaxID=118200 RepID=UPI0023B96FF0|nr:protein PML [Dryobates pubescens]
MASSQLLEDDFQFLHCEGCQQESPSLKLLTCLHTLCLACLSQNKPLGQCPLCHTALPPGAEGTSEVDNLLFTNLQARLKVYRKIVAGVGLWCGNCKRASELWCFECRELLCTKCFRAHQRYLKGHEMKRVVEIRAGSAKDFLEGSRRNSSWSCSQPRHKNQTVSIYCRQCGQALCCSCALLDSQHAPFCDIRSESQRRQQELGALGQQVRRGRSGFEAAVSALRAQAGRLEEAWRELRELIRQRAEQLVALIRREEEELLGLAEARRERGRGRLEAELRRLEGVVRRLEAGERLVEKMGLYGTEQEVMEMQPFVKGSLQELQRLQPPAGEEPAPGRELSECRARLQALVERVTGRPGSSTPRHSSPSEDATPLILDLEPPRERCQPAGGLPPGLPAQHQPWAPSLPLPSAGGPLCPERGGLRAEEGCRSAPGDTEPLPRSIQGFLASLKEDLGGWARSNTQQTEELLGTVGHLLQAQQRTNRHLEAMIQEIQALSRSLAPLTSLVAPLPQPGAAPPDLLSPDTAWPSLPSDLLELPSCSEPCSPASEGERPEPRRRAGGKRGARLQKRRRK